MTGVDHQPLKVSVVPQGLQNLLPDSLVTPPAEPAVYIFPVSIRLWQVPPRCSSTQYPEYTVDKLPSIPGVASSCPFFTDGVRSDFLPRFVIDVMPLLFCCHFSAPPFSLRTIISHSYWRRHLASGFPYANTIRLF